METETAAPWWLEGGSETCHFCLQHYGYEMEYRCVECDRAVCPMCASQIRSRTYCCDCKPGEE